MCIYQPVSFQALYRTVSKPRAVWSAFGAGVHDQFTDGFSPANELTHSTYTSLRATVELCPCSWPYKEMPIFHNDLEHGEVTESSPSRPPQPPSDPNPLGHRRLSEESLPAELCEGPIPDSPRQPSPPNSWDESQALDRSSLIERLKRGGSPTWIPNRHVSVPDIAEFPFCASCSLTPNPV